MRKWIGLFAAGLLLAAGAANAAPVNRPTTLNIEIAIQGLDAITIASTASIAVDETASSIAIPAGAIALTAKVVIPVTATTAVASLSAKTISNLAGTISPSGAAGITGEAACPPATTGLACVQQTGVGGAMGFTGSLNVAVVPMVVVIPVNLNNARLGQGGATSSPFTIDAAPWTTKTGSVNVGGTPYATLQGTVSVSASRFTLVSPSFVSALGNILPLFGTLQVAFTDGNGLPAFMPEPTAMLGIGAALGALALLTRRRR